MMRRLPSCVVSCVALAGVIGASGCGGQAGYTPDAIVEDVFEGEIGFTDNVSITGIDDDESSLADATLVGEPDPAANRVVYFAYDSSLLSVEGEAVVHAHAQRLVANTVARIVLEGHADERGTREYNLALAENRANAVAQVMQAYGINRGRIKAVSFGEERPLAFGHNETAWRMNRRVEILY